MRGPFGSTTEAMAAEKGKLPNVEAGSLDNAR
jgi:hypothetical protein